MGHICEAVPYRVHGEVIMHTLSMSLHVICLLQVDTVIPIGGDGVVCVKANDYGVVFITESRNIHCATCRYGKSDCNHIRKLKLIIDSVMAKETTGIPELEQFQEILYGSKTQKLSSYYLTCLSSKPIPFQPVPETLSIKLQLQTLQQRLNIVEGVCCLTPEWKPCPLCQLENWSEEELSDCLVVLSNQFLPAKGKYCMQ